MKKDIGYIVKRVIIGLLIVLILSMVKNCQVKADTFAPSITINNNPLRTNNYEVATAGNNTFVIDYSGYWGDLPTDKWYVSTAFCMDNNSSSAYINGQTASTELQVFNTQYSCFYPNSSYGGGHVVIINYKATGGGSYNRTPIVMYFNAYSSIALIDFQTSPNSFVDQSKFASISSFAEQKKIYQSTQSIINKQDETNNKLDGVNSSINTMDTHLIDDSIAGADSEVNSLLQNSAFRDSTGLTAVISAPLNFISNLSNTCSPINLTLPYFKNNTQVTLPCISSLLQSKVPTVKSLLVIVINGFIVYRILIELFYIVKSARNPEDDRIEVLDL